MPVSTQEKIRLSDLSSRLKLPIDVLVCSASYEERCKSIPNSLNPDMVVRALICENEDIEAVKPNAEDIRQAFGSKSYPVKLRTDDPVKVADSIREALKDLTSVKPLRYLIDITTFTHEALLILLRLLQISLKKEDSLQFAYSPAKDYSIGSKPSEKWLSKGIDDIRSVLGYPGSLAPSRKIHLIVLVGYESERASSLIAAYEPAVVSLGFGKKEQSISEDLYDINMVFYKGLAEKYRNVRREFSFSCINPTGTKNTIEQEAKALPDFNVVVAAMNTKISTVGAALAAFSNSDIQLCYAHANQYNIKNYSSPSEECYLFEIPSFIK